MVVIHSPHSSQRSQLEFTPKRDRDRRYHTRLVSHHDENMILENVLEGNSIHSGKSAPPTGINNLQTGTAVFSY